MKIAVLGTGMVGQALAGRLAELGHEVDRRHPRPAGDTGPHRARRHGQPAVLRLGARTPRRAAGDLRRGRRRGRARRQRDQRRRRRSTALSRPGADNLAGKVLLDISNPLDFSQGFPPTLFVKDTDSLGEQIQRAFPEARVVKTLNTMNADLMVDPAPLAGGDHSVFVSGDDADAKETVTELLRASATPTSSTSATSAPPAAPRCCCRSGCGSWARWAPRVQLQDRPLTMTRPGPSDDRPDRAGHRRHRRDRQGHRRRARRTRRAGRHHRPGRHARARPPPRSAPRRPAVDVFVADMSSQAEVRRLAGEVLDGLPAARCARQQRRWLLGAPPRHRRRPGAHLRPQPPRPVPAHQAAARPAPGERAGPGGHGLVRRAGDGPHRLRRPPGRAGTTRGSGPTTSPNWPTCCSPTSWPGGSRAPVSPPTCCTPASCAPRSAPEDPAPWMRLMLPLVRPFLKTPEQGAATSIHLASSPEVERRDRPVLRQQQAQEVLRRAATTTPRAARLWDVSCDARRHRHRTHPRERTTS